MTYNDYENENEYNHIQLVRARIQFKTDQIELDIAELTREIKKLKLENLKKQNGPLPPTPNRPPKH